MEVQGKRKSYIQQQNFPNGEGPSVLKRPKNEKPIVNRIEGGGDGDNKVVDDGFLDSFPLGYRFCPLNVELILCYLKKKIIGLPFPRNRIMEVNLYSYNPDRLAELHKQYGEKELYFFTPREKKYRNGTRPNRSVGGGYWKATGVDQEIKCDESIVGYRKPLVFYKGKTLKGDKTSWIMHAYRVHDPPPPKQDKGYNEMRLDDFILYKMYKKIENNSVKTEFKNADSSPSIQNEDSSPSIQNEDPSPSIQNEDLSPSIQNVGKNEILASDEQHMMHYPLIGELVTKIFPEEQFPSPYFPDGIVPDEFGNSLGDFVDYSPVDYSPVDYSSVDLYLLLDDLKLESQESRNKKI